MTNALTATSMLGLFSLSLALGCSQAEDTTPPEDPSDSADTAGKLLAIEQPCALPTPDYLEMSAEDKQDSLFAMHVQSELSPVDAFTDSLVALKRTADFLVRSDGGKLIARTFTRTCDVLAAPEIKRVHAFGAVAKARLVIEESPYSGLLGVGDVPAMIRFSIANPVTGLSLPPFFPQLEFIPGIAIKFFVDGGPSANILAMESLAGQGDVHNFFLHDFTNNFEAHSPHSELPEIADRYADNVVNRTTMRTVGKRFAESLELVQGGRGHQPFHRTCDRMAAVTRDGTAVDDPQGPSWLVFRPAADVLGKPDVIDPTPSVDFREKLGHLVAGDRVYDVFAVEDGTQRHIGFLELESTPEHTLWGDRELFIQHDL